MRFAIVALVSLAFIALLAACGDDDESDGAVTEATETPTGEPTEPAAAEPTLEPTVEPPPETPEPAGPATTFGDGTFVVGQDITPGTYRNSNSSSGCFWERLSGFSGELDDTITNSFTTILQIVTIVDTDAGFSSEDCGTWSQDLSPITADPGAPFGDGIYQVGIDIEPGTWRNEASSGCFWARLSGFSGDIDDTITNDFSDTQQIVTIQATDVGFHSEDCGTWQLQ